MRLWVHLLWRQTNGRVLQTAGPREDGKLEALINLHGEAQTAVAWWLYVNSDPRAYNLEPVMHVDKFTSKAGKTYVNQVEDQGAITRFPLSAFLAVNEGYIVEAMIRIKNKNDGSLRPVAEAMQNNMLSKHWGVGAEKREENA
jgi:hypothetical protein